MSVHPEFRDFLIDQLGRVAPRIRARSMFGGVGFYSNRLFFALADDDTLYLKVDDLTREAFEQRGMPPFRPFGETGETMSYHALPADLLEDTEALLPWVEKALAAAARKTKAARSRGRS